MHVSNLEVAKVLTRVKGKNKYPQMEVSNSNSPKIHVHKSQQNILVFYTNCEQQYVYVRHQNHHPPPPPLKSNIPYIVKST